MRAWVWIDAGARFGIGHVVRTESLVGALSVRGVNCVVFCSDHRAARLAVSSTVEVRELDDRGFAAACARGRPDIAIIDKSHESVPASEELAAIRRVVRCMVAFDASDASGAGSDVYVNMVAREDELGPPESTTNRLLGPKYCVLRPNFAPSGRPVRTHRSIAKRLLLCFGGSDPGSLLPRALGALAAVETELHAQALVGALVSRETKRAAEAAAGRCRDVELCFDVTDPMEAMSGCDLALVSFGFTAIEAVALGTPCVTWSHSPEHTAVGARFWRHFDPTPILDLGDPSLHQAGQVIAATLALADDSARRESMSKSDLLDDKGAARIVAAVMARVERT